MHDLVRIAFRKLFQRMELLLRAFPRSGLGTWFDIRAVYSVFVWVLLQLQEGARRVDTIDRALDLLRWVGSR